MKRVFPVALLAMLFLGWFLSAANLDSWAAEKLRFGTALKIPPHNSLPPLAAEEKGFWKSQGL